MGQAAIKEAIDDVTDALPELKDAIPELKDLTLRGVVSLNEELGHGAYGCVFKVKYGEVVCAAKKIHPILIENVDNTEKQRIKGDFIRECLCCSCIRHQNIVQFIGVYYHSDLSSLPMMVMELMDTIALQPSWKTICHKSRSKQRCLSCMMSLKGWNTYIIINHKFSIVTYPRTT